MTSVAHEPEGSLMNRKTVGEVYTIIGWGKYHTILFIVCGLGWMADAIETGLLSFLKKEVVKEWPYLADDSGGMLSGAFLLTSLQYMVFIGEFIGCFIWGPLADRYGRRMAFLFSNIGLCFFGLLSAASPSFGWLVAFRFVVGICIGGVIIPFDMLIESCEESKAAQVSFGVQYFWTAGTLYINLGAAVILPMDAHDPVIQPWRLLAIVAAIPIIMAALGYFVMEESPLWLQDKGRDEEAMNVLRRIAKMRGRELGNISLIPYAREAEPSFAEVVMVPYRRRTISFAFIWLLGLFGYYGASLADPYIFPEKPDGSTDYTVIFFSACGEVFGVFAFSMLSKFMPPVRSMLFFFAFAGVFVLLIYCKYIEGFPNSLLTIIVFFARAGCMGAGCGYYLVTPTAYPTHIRCTAHSFINLFGRAGGFFATVVGSLEFGLQLGMYGGANVICALIAAVDHSHLLNVEEAFAVLAEDLSGSHIEKQKSRSFASGFGSGAGSYRGAGSVKGEADSALLKDRAASVGSPIAPQS